MRNLIIILGIFLAACGPAPTQTKMVKVTKAIEKPVEVTEAVPEIVEATRTATIIIETVVVEEIVVETMYVCGIDRCEMSGAYGELLFVSGINVWENPDPNRGKAIRQLDHLQVVTVLIERRVSEGSGGLWYRLEGGGWINDLWLTEETCTTSNLEQYSLDDC